MKNFLNKNICAKTWQLLVAGVAVVCLLIALSKGCGVVGNNNKYNAQLVERLDSMTLANQKLDSIVNKKGQEVQVQQALVVNKQADIKKLTDSIFNLKKKNQRQIKNIIAYYSQKTSTVIDSIPVLYKDTAEYRKFKDSLDYYRFAKDSLIIVPKHLQTDSAGVFHLDATITKTSLSINNLTIVDSQYVRIVENKGGFFRKVNGKLKFHVPKSVQFQSFHTNPLIHVTGQNSVLYQPNAKSNWLPKIIALGVGILIGTRL